ncbi:hypothetical protein AVEN_235213-1 [Araneus ventricosus]|uniref:Uncharacterized protein n=1 Tax=Araneus ventricosus TaxID=182803 RepID=A0A4Y2MSV3_ARAVE|nr:hypothetical protein AVEN_235213-1 [Araneus ventricosus]
MARIKHVHAIKPQRFPRATASGFAIQQSERQRAKASKSARKQKPKACKSTRKQKPERLISTKKQTEVQKSNETKSPKVNGQQISKLCQERFLVDGRYRFVYDLFKTVKELKSPRFDDEDLPILERFFIFFEKYHKEKVQNYVRDQRGNFSRFIKKFIGEDVDMEAFHTCLKKFENKYKPDDYSETGFVCYCSAIAYVGIHFVEKGNHRAWENAFMYVFNLLCDALDKSTFKNDLSESSW